MKVYAVKSPSALRLHRLHTQADARYERRCRAYGVSRNLSEGVDVTGLAGGMLIQSLYLRNRLAERYYAAWASDYRASTQSGPLGPAA